MQTSNSDTVWHMKLPLVLLRVLLALQFMLLAMLRTKSMLPIYIADHDAHSVHYAARAAGLDAHAAQNTHATAPASHAANAAGHACYACCSCWWSCCRCCGSWWSCYRCCLGYIYIYIPAVPLMLVYNHDECAIDLDCHVGPCSSSSSRFSCRRRRSRSSI